MDDDIIIEELPDGRYAITKDDWEKSQIAWAESVKEAYRQGMEEAAKICDFGAKFAKRGDIFSETFCKIVTGASENLALSIRKCAKELK
ncbi:MAG: hypothetical protein NUV80_02695 [Candidatus Berkelbacteria bacterium]|nr:hypothetical protein [Candidatus Berkelbacteria bacterium]